MRLVVLVMALSFASCGGDQGPEPMGPDPSTIGKAGTSGSGAVLSDPSTHTPPGNPGTTPANPGTSPAKAPELTEAGADKLMGRFVALLKLVAADLVAAKGKCPTMASTLNGWVDKHGVEAKQIYLQLGVAQKFTNVMKKHAPELAQTQAVFGKATAPCMKDPAVEKAAKRFILALQGKAK
jgi:hypothetical protein